MQRLWDDALAEHGERWWCVRCWALSRLRVPGELAHVLPRENDPWHDRERRIKYVHPLAVVRLCGPTPAGCHGLYDSHSLNLRPFLTPAQIDHAIARVVDLGYGEGRALRYIEGPDYS